MPTSSTGQGRFQSYLANQRLAELTQAPLPDGAVGAVARYASEGHDFFVHEGQLKCAPSWNAGPFDCHSIFTADDIPTGGLANFEGRQRESARDGVAPQIMRCILLGIAA